jgi:hypothetical protein
MGINQPRNQVPAPEVDYLGTLGHSYGRQRPHLRNHAIAHDDNAIWDQRTPGAVKNMSVRKGLDFFQRDLFILRASASGDEDRQGWNCPERSGRQQPSVSTTC